MQRLSLMVVGLVLSLLPLAASPMTAQAADPEPEPLLSFPVISDVHINSGDKTATNLTRAMEQFDRELPRMDVVASVGDLTDHGTREQLQKYRDTYDNSAAAGVPEFLTMGNHDDPGTAALFRSVLGVEAPTQHQVFNGFHFIGVGTDMITTVPWLEAEMAKAAAADPDKPIFVFFHYPLEGTVYGSEPGEWGVKRSAFRAVLAKYPQAITFSGHSHYPGENPRNIWQGEFTALNTGIGLNYLEMEKIWAQGGFPDGTDTLAQGLGVQVFSDKVVIQRRDITRDEWFGEEWVIPLPITKENFTYTDTRDQVAPEFPADAAISVERAGAQAVTVTWDIATDNSGFINGYYLQARNRATGEVDARVKVSSEYWKRPVPTSFTWDLVGLKPGVDYTMEVVAVDAFFNESAPLTVDHTTEPVVISDAWSDQQAVELGASTVQHVKVSNAGTTDHEAVVSVAAEGDVTFDETTRTVTVPAEGEVIVDFTVTGGSTRQTATITSSVATTSGEPLGELSNLLFVGYVYGESFDRLASTLGPAVDENTSLLGFTHEPPQDWTVTNAEGMPQGTEEWQGWSFATMEFWTAADGQNRADFTRSHGVFAIADGDEWDDTGSPAGRGTFDSTLTTPVIPVTAGEAYELVFDSHYLQEDPQRSSVTVVYTDADGAEVSRKVLLDYGPDGADNSGQHAANREIAKNVTVPAHVTGARFEFRYYDAGNNWYWAVDNVRLAHLPFGGLEIAGGAAAPDSVKVGEPASFDVTLSNRGGEALEAVVDAAVTSGPATVGNTPKTVTVPAGGSVVVSFPIAAGNTGGVAELQATVRRNGETVGTVTSALTVVAPQPDDPDDTPGDPDDTPGDEDPDARAPGLTVAPGQVARGGVVTFTATGFTAGEKITFTVHSKVVTLPAVVADANGVATVAWTVPADFELGRHRVEAVSPSGTATGTFVVVPEGGGPVPAGVPDTGR